MFPLKVESLIVQNPESLISTAKQSFSFASIEPEPSIVKLPLFCTEINDHVLTPSSLFQISVSFEILRSMCNV